MTRTTATEPAADHESEPPPPHPEADLFDEALESRIHAIGKAILENARRRSGHFAAHLSERLLDWATKDEAFKRQLFHFVEAFPALRTSAQIHDHLVEYLLRPDVKLPTGLGPMLHLGGIAKSPMAWVISRQIWSMASRFIAGADAVEAMPTLERLWARGTGFTINLLGEKCLSHANAEAYQETYLKLLRDLSDACRGWPPGGPVERDHLGPVPRVNISLKLSALHPMPDPIGTDAILPRLQATIQPILDEAERVGALINFDIEQFFLKDLFHELFMRCAESTDAQVGVVIQAYLRSSEADAQRLIDFTRRTGRQISVRLVKGAYWDYETEHAEDMGWLIPVWSRKADTDACYERVAAMLVAATPRSRDDSGIKLALGSHNARSIAATLALLAKNDLPSEALELQMLLGMGDELKSALAADRHRLREYVPVGEMIPGMSYLVRRLLENTSNESWLKLGFRDHASAEDLLASPHGAPIETDPGIDAINTLPERLELSPAFDDVGDGRPFINEPWRNFAHRSVRDAFASAIRSAAPIDGTLSSTDGALSAARGAASRWRERPSGDRARVLTETARRLRGRCDEIAGRIIRQSGKTWRDADIEVCRAIDFCEYHARHGTAMCGASTGRASRPRIAVIEQSWRSPLGGLTGSATAALIAGHGVILKVAPQTSALAHLLHDALLEAGCDAALVHCVAADGRATDDASVDMIDIAAVSGGGNAMLVDESADVDDAVIGILDCGFGFQGQRPTACSHIIVHRAAYDAFLDRLCESTRDLAISDPLDAATFIGPVIDDAARAEIESFIEAGRTEARLALAVALPDASRLATKRPYIAPHIFADVPVDSTLARRHVSGPVVAVLRADSFAESLDYAAAIEHGRHVGVYSRKPSNVDAVRKRFGEEQVCVNGPITEPRVGRQSVDGEPGSPAYLRRFISG